MEGCTCGKVNYGTSCPSIQQTRRICFLCLREKKRRGKEHGRGEGMRKGKRYKTEQMEERRREEHRIIQAKLCTRCNVSYASNHDNNVPPTCLQV